MNPGSNVVVTKTTDAVRVQTEKFQSTLVTDKVKTALAREFKVGVNSVSANTIGPSWGASGVSRRSPHSSGFLVLVSLVLAAYFDLKMSVAALIALAHDLVITIGIYALAGFEVTPASVIGFLTILGYSLYDTVVVFDKRSGEHPGSGGERSAVGLAGRQPGGQPDARPFDQHLGSRPVAGRIHSGHRLLACLGRGRCLTSASRCSSESPSEPTSGSIFIATPVLADLREREPP